MILPRKAILLAALPVLGAGCSGPPVRDVFVPPYADKGCWARFYEHAGFGAPMRQLEGPAFVEAMQGAPVVVPNMESAGMQPLFGELRSLAIGPHARLVGYAQPLFREPSLELAPGTSVEDLGPIAFHDRVGSFKVLCEA